MAFLVMAAATCSAADRVKITVSNPAALVRSGEMVEVPLSVVQKKLGTTVRDIVVTDADGRELASQQTHDGLLIFQAAVGSKGRSVYYARVGTPQVYESRVFGRQFPERVDDVAWENDRVAYRCYGPALQRSGERAWGYDIWNKRTNRLVVEDRYALELDPEVASVSRKLRGMGQGELAQELYYAVSYHVDHGNGMDCYKVGPTLGAGTMALLDGESGDIVYPHCYASHEILDCGPLRFTVRLVYPAETVNGQQVVETRVVSLDAGSQMNKAVVTYEGLTRPMRTAVGIVVHNENPTAYVLNPSAGYMGYEDLGDVNQYKEAWREKLNKDFGQIYVGSVFAGPVTGMEFREGSGLPGACGHILGISDCRNATAITYYFGSGWSRNESTSFHSLKDWEAYLTDFATRVKKPLKVKF